MLQKLKLALIFLIVSVSHIAYSQTELPLIPKPDTIIFSSGNFSFTNDIKIVASKGNYAVAQQWLSESANLNYTRASHASKKVKNIILKVDKHNTSEGYRLTVTSEKIELLAGKKGLIRGLATITQLAWCASERNNQIPCLTINDNPQFSYRGVHLDVSRHFFDVTFIKKYIDLIALYKMNTFHWHLVDDQGWRIEIKKYPKLTSVGANRAGSMVGPYRDHKIDSIPYGGYYTQKEIKEVIKYAADRGVTIIPEIEMPGHSMAALAAYPEFSCKGGTFQVSTGYKNTK